MRILQRAVIAGMMFGFVAGSWGVDLPSAPQASFESLTLQSSLERATSNNSQLLLAKKDLDVAQTHLAQARSQYYPKINLNADYVRYRHETLGVLPPELGNVILETPKVDAEGGNGNPAQNLYFGRLGFVQTLYSGGKLDTTYRLSQAGVKRAESGYESLKRNVEFETANGFFRLLSIRKKQELYQSALVDLEKMARQARGVHGRLAVLTVQADLRKQLGESRQVEQTVRFDYLRAMGVELFTDVQVEGSLAIKTKERDLQTDLIWAKQNRVELKETQLQEEVDKLSVNLSMAERYPVFLLGGGMEVRNDSFPLDQTNWNAALSMNIPLFDGFSSIARIRESRFRADQGRLRRVQLEDQVESEVRTAFGDYKHWKEELEARGKELETLEAPRRQFLSDAGGNMNDQLDYVRWVLNARIAVIDAQFELCMANARLAKSMGRSILDE